MNATLGHYWFAHKLPAWWTRKMLKALHRRGSCEDRRARLAQR
jgi:hypothetical protein